MQKTDLGAVTLSHSRTGEGRRHLVLLHGGGEDSTVWDGLREQLSPEFSTIAFDLPGVGDSTEPPADASVADMARWFLQVLQEQGMSTYSLVGVGAGAAVAARVAEADNLSVRRLILVSPESRAHTGGSAFLEHFIAVEEWQRTLVKLRASAMIVDGQDEPELEKLDWIPRLLNRPAHRRLAVPREELLTAGAGDVASAISEFVVARAFSSTRRD